MPLPADGWNLLRDAGTRQLVRGASQNLPRRKTETLGELLAGNSNLKIRGVSHGQYGFHQGVAPCGCDP